MVTGNLEKYTGIERQQRLNDAFLLAATINMSGNIDLVSVREGWVETHARVAFMVGGEGEILQQRYLISPPERNSQATVLRKSKQEPLDMVYLAECLEYALGELTPTLFKLAKTGSDGQQRLLLVGEHYDRARMRLLHNAFNIYLLAYEEQLV